MLTSDRLIITEDRPLPALGPGQDTPSSPGFAPELLAYEDGKRKLLNNELSEADAAAFVSTYGDPRQQ